MLIAPVSRTQVTCRWNFFSILVTGFRGWHKSTMIRWRRLSRAATAPGSWYNSTRAAGGNSPVFTVAECRRAVRKFSSSLELSKLLALSSTRRGLPVNCSSHTPAPCCKHPTTVAAPMIPFMSSGHMMKQKRWALVEATVALAKASSRWDCFSSVESSWKLYPRPPVRKPIFVWARSTCWCCHTCTRRDPSWDHPSFRVDHPVGAVQRTRHIVPIVEDSQTAIFTSFQLQLLRDPLYHLPNVNRCMDHIVQGPPENWHETT